MDSQHSSPAASSKRRSSNKSGGSNKSGSSNGSSGSAKKSVVPPQEENKHRTIQDEDLGKLSKAEKEMMKVDWSEFKDDVSKKQLISQIDKAIKRRHRLYISDDPEEAKRIENFRLRVQKFKPFKIGALLLYCLLPFFEKPGWCI